MKLHALAALAAIGPVHDASIPPVSEMSATDHDRTE